MITKGSTDFYGSSAHPIVQHLDDQRQQIVWITTDDLGNLYLKWTGDHTPSLRCLGGETAVVEWGQP